VAHDRVPHRPGEDGIPDAEAGGDRPPDAPWRPSSAAATC
jgi:hypothetical protein